MRTILFKAKRADNAEWVEGSLVFDAIGQPRIAQVDKSGKGLVFHKVILETVCQYTGLDDKNGVKIWEGSRIKSGKFEYCIVFENGAFYANCINLNDFDNKSFRWILARRFSDLRTDYEVIGNIHD